MSRIERKIAFICASTLLLSTLEYLIPKPLPFLRLGLANLPLLVILDNIAFLPYLAILVVKAIGQGMVSGTLFSYLFFISLAGTLSSGLAMKAVKSLFKGHVSTVGCSLVGAFVSNLAQLQVASWVAYGPSIWVAAPLMLTLGLVTSFVLGLLAGQYLQKGSIPKALKEDSLALGMPLVSEKAHYSSVAVGSLVAIIAILFAEGTAYLAVLTLLMYGMQAVSGRRIRILPPLMLTLSLVVLSLFEPNGKVLLSIGSVAFTEGALLSALTKALRLVSLLAASQCLSASNPRIKGKAGAVLMLTLSYFSVLSSSFKATSGSLIHRIDQALLTTASVDAAAPCSPIVAKKPIKASLFLLLTGIIITIAIISRFSN